MTMELLDRSNYLKGLLILIRKDKLISPEEKKLVLDCGLSLGFERRFCETAIEEILENEHISDAPPVFSNKELAEAFLRDAVRVALSDKKMHMHELQWLVETAIKNEFSGETVNDLIKHHISDNAKKMGSSKMEFQKMTVE